MKKTSISKHAHYYFKYLLSVTQSYVMYLLSLSQVSEGLDFSNRKARGVIIFGVPYSPFKDLRIMGKKQYLDGKKKQVRSHFKFLYICVNLPESRCHNRGQTPNIFFFTYFVKNSKLQEGPELETTSTRVPTTALPVLD